MKTSTTTRVLAIDPSVSGFGYAVLEGPGRLVDWGVKTVAGEKNARCLKWIAHFIKLYAPDLVVVENSQAQGSRRCRRVRELIMDIRDFAAQWSVRTRSFSRSDVHVAFAPLSARRKHEIARVISEMFPELAPQVPPHRRCWMREDDRMNIFDAMALALTFFYFRNPRGSDLGFR
jgi:hypothetical protein